LKQTGPEYILLIERIREAAALAHDIAYNFERLSKVHEKQLGYPMLTHLMQHWVVYFFKASPATCK
jgi:hypothetical protein